ncbi:hypothetical protein ABT025_29480 [Streptomyces sp. NPDC002809]|uniref:hypothetical protein n=1 Tax=Streptomyces sp. NPDC002809 TaxID=3154433 RepID=UPI003316E7E6
MDRLEGSQALLTEREAQPSATGRPHEGPPPRDRLGARCGQLGVDAGDNVVHRRLFRVRRHSVRTALARIVSRGKADQNRERRLRLPLPPGRRIAELPHHRTAASPNFLTTELPDHRTAALPNYRTAVMS